MKTISILLTKYSDAISNIIFLLDRSGYTHASIALEEDENCFYSFNYRGFAIESIEKHKRRGVKKSLCFILQITENSYSQLKYKLENFKDNYLIYKYTRLGAVFAFLRIPFYWENHYFCSQFVAQLLTDSGAMPLRKEPHLYLPSHFLKDIPLFQGLQETICNII